MKNISIVVNSSIIILFSIILVCDIVLFRSILSHILGVVFVLYFPGYVVLSAILPSNIEISTIEKIVLSMVGSILIVVLIGLILALSPIGFRLGPLIIFLVSFVLVVSIINILKRNKYINKGEISKYLSTRASSYLNDFRARKSVKIFYLTSLGIIVCVLLFSIIKKPMEEQFTEFYLISPEDITYKLSNTVGFLEATIPFVIHNEEGEQYSYKLSVTAIDDKKSYLIYENNYQVDSGLICSDSLTLNEIPINTNFLSISLFSPKQPNPYRILKLFITGNEGHN
jgi:uncharacterized membrane protein